MQYQKLRQTRKILKASSGFVWHNKVLFSGFALPFIVVAATSLKNSAALSIAMFFCTVPTALLMSFIPTSYPKWLRAPLASFISMIFVLLSYFPIQFISLEIFDSVGIFLPLVAVSALVFELAGEGLHGKWADATIQAGVRTLGFTVVALATGLVRELLGSGSIWGNAIMKYKVPGFLPVFSGFIVIAFLAAAVRQIWRVTMAACIRADNPAREKDKKRSGAV